MEYHDLLIKIDKRPKSNQHRIDQIEENLVR